MPRSCPLSTRNALSSELTSLPSLLLPEPIPNPDLNFLKGRVSLKSWSMKTITIAYSGAFWYYCVARMLSGPPPEIITRPWAQFGRYWRLLTHDCSYSSPFAWSQPSSPSNPPRLSLLFSHWHWMSKFSKSPRVKKLGASISHLYDKDDEAASQGGAFTGPHCSTPTAEQRMDNVWKPKRNPGMPQRCQVSLYCKCFPAKGSAPV